MEDNEQTLTKIKKVLELARRGGTEGEANAAMLRVQEMLAKYNLEMSQVEDHSTEEKTQVHVFSHYKRVTFRRWIWNDVASLYFCHTVHNPYSNPPSMVVIGKPSNVAIVRDLVEYLIDLCEKLASEESEGYAARAYRQGFAERISARCFEAIRQAKEGGIKDSETGTSIIVHPLYDKAGKANKAVAESIFKKIREGKGSKVQRNDAYYRGQERGNSAPLSSHGIPMSQQKKRIG